MAGSSLLTLLDDIATLLDDISVMGKVAAKKTASVLGDDLSLNAQQVSGVRANRELPVVWGVAKGSLLNKVILVPLALLISTFIPWAITPLLMLGGAYLCFEGMEKVVHSLTRHKDTDPEQARIQRLEALNSAEMQTYERNKIKGAIRTDFVLSAEVVTITLGIVAQAPLLNQILVLSGIALLVTVGVYGIVGVIVKLDDMGYWLVARKGQVAHILGRGLLALAPRLMRFLTIAGTLAMFLVGGGIVAHGIGPLHHLTEQWAAAGGAAGEMLIPLVVNMVVGAVCGGIIILLVEFIQRLRGGGDS
ncbi:DUF808 family protein [Shimwellia blattae]|uniref:Putative methyl-independent mismatch repair protein n=1 Tax=Shimwellia blattae (strain ATCC 29907 / DSM 4481 / JCM 1650 / NBRC 105725 / CDC 9005-74) TaxID=630626 RepID=I2B7Y0_SHIBC|nr:DUF808 family protein [Shimwellia blattae]AFJ46634.1 putative methyl-independent mismatch repair protein [Shimwellia blattae DSM 4481 = NBRC 105725]GAB80214.1 hypothetical protein YedI [Shimwellia blattae DSM 4481 = NBRC 105725]VDY64106.1 Inner membrane protein yedI [Shimwellia blattae]VEC22238.1 Inner membrane protein yedI [Shimwellia blattae]